MAKNKTTETKKSVTKYLNAVTDEKSARTIKLINKQTGFEPKMQVTSMVGFGSYHYKYETGHEGNAPLAGTALRKNTITLYLASGFDEKEGLLQKFVKDKTGKDGFMYKNLKKLTRRY